MTTANQIRDMLLERLALCMRVPSMCGGELGILNLMEYLSFIDDREDEWRAERRKLSESGAFGPTGIHGGFWAATRQNERDESQPASVYALIAFEMGYLNADSFDRILTRDEFDRLLTEFDDAFFQKKWTNVDVIAGRVGAHTTDSGSPGGPGLNEPGFEATVRRVARSPVVQVQVLHNHIIHGALQLRGHLGLRAFKRRILRAERPEWYAGET